MNILLSKEIQIIVKCSRLLAKLDSVLTQLDVIVARLDSQDKDMEEVKEVLKDIKARI